MVLSFMKRILKILFIIGLAVCFSCEEKGWFPDCNDCTAEIPLTTDLFIKVTGTELSVLISIYEGELEDSVLYDSAFVYHNVNEYTSQVPVNKTYTITATYKVDDDTYIAVDSATPKVRYTEDQCEEACYYVYDREVDLRLKYTAKQQ
jgi:hypothetical protein